MSSSAGIVTWLLMMVAVIRGHGFMALCWALGGFCLYGGSFPLVLAIILVSFLQQFSLLYFLFLGVKFLSVGHWAFCMDLTFWLFNFLDFFLILSHLCFCVLLSGRFFSHLSSLLMHF